MTTSNGYVERARASEYFSGAHLGEDLARFLDERGDSCRELGRELRGAEQFYFVGCGGSLATLQTSKYLLDGGLEVPSEAVHGYDLIWRKPTRLKQGAVAFFASYSGETEDTVAALRFARERGARTVGIVRGGDSTIAREADEVIEYGSAAIFEAPIAAMVLVGAGASEGRRGGEAMAMLADRLRDVPAAVAGAVESEEGRAEARAREFSRAGICMCSERGRLLHWPTRSR